MQCALDSDGIELIKAVIKAAMDGAMTEGAAPGRKRKAGGEDERVLPWQAFVSTGTTDEKGRRLLPAAHRHIRSIGDPFPQAGMWDLMAQNFNDGEEPALDESFYVANPTLEPPVPDTNKSNKSRGSKATQVNQYAPNPPDYGFYADMARAMGVQFRRFPTDRNAFSPVA